MAMAIPTKIGINGNISSNTPMVELAHPISVINTGIITARADPFNILEHTGDKAVKSSAGNNLADGGIKIKRRKLRLPHRRYRYKID